jgi:hypothetical protein
MTRANTVKFLEVKNWSDTLFIQNYLKEEDFEDTNDQPGYRIDKEYK